MTKARDIASAAPAPSTVSATEIGYLDGVSSAIQTQIDGKIAKTLTTTTGDMIYASSANTPARLGVGSTGQVLTVSGGVPAWVAPAGGGKVLQVVSATTTTSTVSNSTSFADTALSCSITPSSASSKVLVLVTQRIRIASATSTGDIGGNLKLLRNSTDLFTNTAPSQYTAGLSSVEARSIHAISYLDSPNTTSATTYKTQIATNYTSGYYTSEGFQSMVLLEIGA